jgi:hypothetical protein
MKHEHSVTSAHLTTPRAAAVAGIVFSLLFIASMILIWISVPADPQEAGAWLPRHWRTVNLALALLPFAGIAFLWFIGVLRDRIGHYEDRFFATVFLGSGLLFLAMLFTGSAMSAGIIMTYGAEPGKLLDSGIYLFGRTVTHQIIHGYMMKMAAVFMISTCMVSLQVTIFPRWMGVLGFLLAALMLLSLGYLHWVPLVFPLWVLLISVHILVTNLQPKTSAGT